MVSAQTMASIPDLDGISSLQTASDGEGQHPGAPGSLYYKSVPARLLASP
jgi:hypothetical protein